jgi:hypothetical protein
MVDPLASEAELQHAVARADRARRGRETARRLWTMAPVAAGVCLVIAIGGRLRGWTPFVTLFVLAVAAIALGAYVVIARRQRALSDAEVSSIDADAGLKGELRSAHWFATQPADASADAGGDWILFHLSRAAERVRGVDWAGLYPAPAAGRAKLATVMMAVGAVALLLIPGRAGLAASDARRQPNAATAKRPGTIIAIPPELRKKLEEMLTTAEGGQGRELTAAEVRDLLAKLEALAHQDPAKQAAQLKPGERPASEADVKALAERAKKASESTDLEPEVRDALADMANKLNDADQDANAMASRDAQDAAVDKDKQEGGEAQQSKSGSGKPDASASVQSVKETSGGSAVGVVMMSTDDASSARDGGLGLGGGAADKKGNGQLADLGAALRKETIEAAKDLQGDNVQTEERRKTEQGTATTAYSHAAVQSAERGSSTAPPPVPESRRAAVKSYFIRKQ